MNSEGQRHILEEGNFVRLVHRNGWEWAERTNNTGVVAVIAITENDELVLTEQYRPPVAARVLDLPMGLSGDLHHAPDEDMREAARRELLEETGYRADRLELLLEGPTSAGLTNEMLAIFLARDARKVEEGGGDETEDIEVHVVSLGEAETWFSQKRDSGVLLDPKLYAALYFARQSNSNG